MEQVKQVLPPGYRLEGGNLKLPPGYRFLPSDLELIIFYLYNKVHNIRMPTHLSDPIMEHNLYGKEAQEPHELFRRNSSQDELYFYTKIKKKFDRGTRIERIVGNGTWKMQNTTEVYDSKDDGTRQLIGLKTTLNFDKKGYRDSWIMHEYSLIDSGENREGWVVCRIKRGRNNTNPAPSPGLEQLTEKDNTTLTQKRPVMIPTPSTNAVNHNVVARSRGSTPVPAYNAVFSQQLHVHPSQLQVNKRVRTSKESPWSRAGSNVGVETLVTSMPPVEDNSHRKQPIVQTNIFYYFPDGNQK